MGQVKPHPVFAVCACGKHGRLVLEDGRLGMEVYSRKLARLTLGVALEQGLIDKAGLALCREQLRASALPESGDDAMRTDADLCQRVHEWNADLERGKPLDPDTFHRPREAP